MTLTKKELTDSIYERVGIPRNESRGAMETILELMKSTLASGEEILISGFGKFCVNNKSTRKGRNPQTGAGLTLEARRVVTFRPSGVLKRKLNGKR